MEYSQYPAPSRMAVLLDLVNLLRHTGHLTRGSFSSRTFPVPGQVSVMWGLNRWNVVSIEIYTRADGRFACHVNVFGVDGVCTGKRKVMTFSSLVLSERREIYNAMCLHVGVSKYFG